MESIKDVKARAHIVDGVKVTSNREITREDAVRCVQKAASEHDGVEAVSLNIDASGTYAEMGVRYVEGGKAAEEMKCVIAEPAAHGSSDEDEMRARMRDAGYEDWEIEEEIEDRHAAFEAASSPAKFHPKGRDSSSFSAPVPMRGNQCRSPLKDEVEARQAAVLAGRAVLSRKEARSRA